jgi:hypothetical protein
MGHVIDTGGMTDAELDYLALMPYTSLVAAHLSRLACAELFDLQSPIHSSYGRWDLLVWFTQQERIMSPDELAESLVRYRSDGGL